MQESLATPTFPQLFEFVNSSNVPLLQSLGSISAKGATDFWVGLILLLSSLAVGGIAGLLESAAGTPSSKSAMRGGAAFVAALGLFATHVALDVQAPVCVVNSLLGLLGTICVVICCRLARKSWMRSIMGGAASFSAAVLAAVSVELIFGLL